MTVEIKIYGETALDAIRELRDISTSLVSDRQRAAVAFHAALTAPYGSGEQVDPKAGDVYDQTAATIIGSAVRKRGEPSPGKARRTKAEIAEDEAADAGDASGSLGEKPNHADALTDDGEQDSAEVAAQDAADEAAEVEETAGAEVTIEDVKAVVGLYVKSYGMAATQEDGPKIFAEALGAPPEGEPYWKMSLVPKEQPILQKCVATWKKAVELNPLKRTPVAA